MTRAIIHQVLEFLIVTNFQGRRFYLIYIVKTGKLGKNNLFPSWVMEYNRSHRIMFSEDVG
jgi:hypothetical protein